MNGTIEPWVGTGDDGSSEGVYLREHMESEELESKLGENGPEQDKWEATSLNLYLKRQQTKEEIGNGFLKPAVSSKSLPFLFLVFTKKKKCHD